MGKTKIFAALFAFFILTNSDAETTTTFDYGSSGNIASVQRVISTYAAEMECSLGKLAPDADQNQRNRALHFARTLAEVTGSWIPPMSPSWRRHMYAQFKTESAFFADPTENQPELSNISGGETFKGRGWTQLTHDTNYGRFACFKKNLNNAKTATFNFEDLKNNLLPPKMSCDEDKIFSNPDVAFTYTNVANFDQTTDGNKNNDLSAIWYFFNQMNEQEPFAKAMDEITDDSVRKVRRGVQRGDAASETAGLHEEETVTAFQKLADCFDNSAQEGRR